MQIRIILSAPLTFLSSKRGAPPIKSRIEFEHLEESRFHAFKAHAFSAHTFQHDNILMVHVLSCLSQVSLILRICGDTRGNARRG